MDFTLKLSEVTVHEFILLIGSIVFSVFIGLFISRIIIFILEMIIFSIRKNKYKAGYDCAHLYALKHIAKLRKQVKSAKSEKAYFLFYNRLVGAFETYVHLGIFTYKQFEKLCDVRDVYVLREGKKNNEEFEEHTEINPNN